MAYRPRFPVRHGVAKQCSLRIFRWRATTGRDDRGEVWVYDTQNHQIGGFSQQQGVGGSITFSSQFGTVNLTALPVISRNGVLQPPQPMSVQPAVPPVRESATELTSLPKQTTFQPNSHGAGQDLLATIEHLGALKEKGLITEEEFAAKKAELLSRI